MKEYTLCKNQRFPSCLDLRANFFGPPIILSGSDFLSLSLSEAWARPGEAQARPREALARPWEAKSRPWEVQARPWEARARAWKALARPREASARPWEVYARAWVEPPWACLRPSRVWLGPP